MIRARHTILVGLAVSIVGCATNQQPSGSQTAGPTTQADTNSSDPIVASFDGGTVTLSQLQKPLIEGFGLDVMLNLVQLEYAKRELAKTGQSVSPADIQHERDVTLTKMFQDADKADYDQLFIQFLQQQHISKAEFDLVLETNAYLRKLANPIVQSKINDESLQEAFRQLYGETVQVRHIELANLQDIIEAKRRLASGQPFEQVAREMSKNAQTAPLGGELPPFSRSAAGYPQNFKDSAFALGQGEVSDAVEAYGAYHLIKLERRIPPKAVKFEDVKESLREDLADRMVQTTMKQLRQQLAAQAIQSLTIRQPVLRDQYEARLTQRDSKIADHNKIREQFEREKQKILDRAATKPTSTTSPAALAPPASEVARPPATTSAATPAPAADHPPATTQLVH